MCKTKESVSGQEGCFYVAWNSLVIDEKTLFQNLKKEDMTFEEYIL
jgi:hypothetical protein